MTAFGPNCASGFYLQIQCEAYSALGFTVVNSGRLFHPSSVSVFVDWLLNNTMDINDMSLGCQFNASHHKTR